MKTQYVILFLMVLLLLRDVSCSNDGSNDTNAKLTELESQFNGLQTQIDKVHKIIEERDQKVLEHLTANQKTLTSAVEKLGEDDSEAVKDIRVVMQDQQQMITEINSRLKKK